MTQVRLSPWSQRMVVAECLAVATLSIGIREPDISAENFRSAFIEAWSHWESARQFPAIRPEQIVALLAGPRTVPDAIAHWHAERPFRPSLTGGYRQPADVADLIASYTDVALPAWGNSPVTWSARPPSTTAGTPMTITDYFAHAPTITIETVTGDGRPVTTPIWGVVADGACYIRSGYGDSAWWYRRLRRTWRAAVIGHGQRYRVRVEPVTADETRKRVDDAYRAKYRGQGAALRQVVSSPARDYTLRVVLEEEPAVAGNPAASVRRVSATPGSESITLWEPCISR